MCKCKFYEVDAEWLAECEAMESAFPVPELPSGAEGEGDVGPCAECGPCCRFLRSGSGFPGEDVTYCSAPGNEHIIDVDFDVSAVI